MKFYRFVTILSLFLVVNSRLLSKAKRDSRLEFYSELFRISEIIENDPHLKAQWNEAVTYDFEAEIPPVNFTCDVELSQDVPTSVHKLRPSDIKIVAAFGDSISAGNGVGARNVVEVAIENRGESWSIGGNLNLDEHIITLPNILRKFNSKIKGYATCGSQEKNTYRAGYNVARPGACSDDMFSEAQMLVDRMKTDTRIDFKNDWKLLTFLVGGNDLCYSCRNGGQFSPPEYYSEMEKALIYLTANLERTLIQLVTMFDISPLEQFSTGLLCDLFHWGFCSCARNYTLIPQIIEYHAAYHEILVNLTNDPRFKREDFSVVNQPHMFQLKPPVDPETGEIITDNILGPDCFHPSRYSHQGFAIWLWNVMLMPVGKKPTSFDPTDTDVPLSCPSTKYPYIFTNENSLNATDWVAPYYVKRVQRFKKKPVK